MKNWLLTTLLILPLTLLSGGCAKKPVVTETPTPAVTTEAPAVAETAVSEPEKTEAMVVAGPAGMQTIYFAFDSSTLSDEARKTLQDNARWMAANASALITIEGHTDERGSDTYNLALGERRAMAAQNYLVALGVPASRIQVISYGEENPAVAGKGEEAWSKNRRAEFK